VVVLLSVAAVGDIGGVGSRRLVVSGQVRNTQAGAPRRAPSLSVCDETYFATSQKKSSTKNASAAAPITATVSQPRSAERGLLGYRPQAACRRNQHEQHQKGGARRPLTTAQMTSRLMTLIGSTAEGRAEQRAGDDQPVEERRLAEGREKPTPCRAAGDADGGRAHDTGSQAGPSR